MKNKSAFTEFPEVEINLTAVSRRFWSKVARKRASECWEWQAARLPAGYGRFKVDGKAVLAHRVAYELANGPLGEREIVMHVCDNPRCCNPNHLRAGYSRENMADCVKKGRYTLRGIALRRSQNSNADDAFRSEPGLKRA